MKNLANKSIRFYEDCPKCRGPGRQEGMVMFLCHKCDGKGRIVSEIKFGELEKALQEIVKVAVKQFGKEK